MSKSRKQRRANVLGVGRRLPGDTYKRTNGPFGAKFGKVFRKSFVCKGLGKTFSILAPIRPFVRL
jgi:hypothetical protein